MTFSTLHKLLVKHAIPADVKLMSDSGWECNATDMDGIWYNRKENILVFTQEGDMYDYHYTENEDWKLIHSIVKGTNDYERDS